MEAPKKVMGLAVPPTTRTYIRAHLNTICAHLILIVPPILAETTLGNLPSEYYRKILINIIV
ncbi:MAG: hypothetical protein ACLRYY_09565 [Anaerobutyricum soehngenii]